MHEPMPRFLNGYFLIAETDLDDPNFGRSVVLIVRHDDKGAFGLVVNSKTEISLAEATSITMINALRDFKLHVGGPVEREYLFVLHSGFRNGNRSPESIEICPGIVFEPSFSLVSDLYKEEIEHNGVPTVSIRFYSGYSGWGPGQLENELLQKAWVLIPATPDLVFNAEPDKNWTEALKRKGGIYWVYAETGYKPSLN